jgi:hypothetical protein
LSERRNTSRTKKRNFHVKDILKVIAFGVLAFIIFLTTVAAIWNFLDWKTDFLGINPPDKLHPLKVMHLEYPPASISGSIVIHYPNNTVKGLPMLSLDVAIQYRGTLIEQTPVDMGANGYV